MSASSATHSKWRQYGLVPLTRCPSCPRLEPLKRWVNRTDENGNLGREFVKCLSKSMAGRDGKGSCCCFQILKKCTHFEWMDDYVDRIQFKGYVDSSGPATWELNLGGVPQMESSDRGAGRVVPMASYACNATHAEPHLESQQTEELKKIKKNQMEMINLQKQANIMSGGFYFVSLLCLCFACYSSVIGGGI
ncbi:hypothetical protein VPH35_088471 [Triticum aestivum]